MYMSIIRCSSSSLGYNPYLSFKIQQCSQIKPRLSLLESELVVSSSADKVISNQDLLTLILLRLPIRKIICFQSISKLWFYLINLPRFSRLLYDLPLRKSPSAFFLQHNYADFCSPNPVIFVPPHKTSPFRNLPFQLAHDTYPTMVRILQSCAGLLLCSTCPYAAACLSVFKYYLYNPSTNQLLTLSPHSETQCVHCAAFLAFDPSNSPHYRVFICAFNLVRLNYQFHIYSSQTCSWTPSGQPFLSVINFFDNSVYSNGCIHWITDSAGCFYFNLDEGRLETMPSPPTGMNFHIFESENHVHVIDDVYASHNSLTVYEMKSDYSGWFLKYEVDLSPVAQVFPEMTATPDDVYVLSLLRKENFGEDSFLLLHIPGKAIHYNLVDGSFKAVWDIGFPTYSAHLLARPLNSQPRKLKAFQFIESLSYL